MLATVKEERDGSGGPRNLPVTTILSTAQRGIPERARDPDRRAREVERKSIFVEENGAMVLGGDVDVLRKGTAGDEACTFLSTDYVPWPVEVICQGTRIRATCRSRVPGEDLERVNQSSAALIRTKSSTRRATGDCSKNLVASSRSA